MHKFSLQHILTLLISIFFYHSAYAEHIKIYIWEDYISDNVINEFTAKTGHTVELVIYDDEDTRDAIIVSGKSSHYNLMLVDSLSITNFSGQGLFNDISQAPIANRKHITDKWLSSCGSYGLPYSKGTLGIGYRSSINKSPITSWKNILVPNEEHKKRTLMLKNNIDTTAIGLLAHNLDPFSESKIDLKVAFQSLKAQQNELADYKYIISHISEYKEKSEISLAMMYSDDIKTITDMSGQTDWVYVVPDEGTLFWVDCFTSPQGKTLSTATLEFLNFLNIPEIAIQNAEEIDFSTTNETALTLASDEYKNNPRFIASTKVISNSHTYKKISPESMILRHKMLSSLHANANISEQNK